MRGEERLNTINATPPQPRGLLRRYLDRRNRYIVERRLPKFSERPIDWSTNLVHTLVYKIGFAHIGKLTIIAAYFVLTQTLTAGQTAATGPGAGAVRAQRDARNANGCERAS